MKGETKCRVLFHKNDENTSGVVECQGMLCVAEGGHVRCAGD